MSRQISARAKALDVLIRKTDVEEAEEKKQPSLTRWDITCAQLVEFDATDCGAKTSERVGLFNLGATCYLNSLVQSLFACPALVQLVLDYTRPELATEKQHAMSLALQLLFARMLGSKSSAVSTKELTKSFGWSDFVFTQSDASELYTVFLQALLTAWQSDAASHTALRALYTGCSYNFMECGECHTSRRMKQEDFSFLNVQVEGIAEGSVACAVEAHFAREAMEGVMCEACGKKTDSSRGLKLVSTPGVLVVCLQRLVMNRTTFQVAKVNDPVIPSQRLDLAKHMHIDEEYAKEDGGSAHHAFELFAVLAHAGGASSGHYKAYVHHADGWYECNDTFVRRLSQEEFIAHLSTSPHAQGAASGGGSDGKRVGGEKKGPTKVSFNVLRDVNMCVYRRVEAPNPENNDTRPLTLPVHVQAVLDQDNAEFVVRKKKYDALVDKLNVRVGAEYFPAVSPLSQRTRAYLEATTPPAFRVGPSRWPSRVPTF
jgi:ubiquitin C-terminal hydrolase